jgi:hypothetical protein
MKMSSCAAQTTTQSAGLLLANLPSTRQTSMEPTCNALQILSASTSQIKNHNNKTSMGCIYVFMYGTKVFQKLKVKIHAFYAALHKSMEPTCTTLELVPPKRD